MAPIADFKMLSPEAIRELDDLGFTSAKDREYYQSIWESEGEAFFWGYLEDERRSRELCQLWAPRLREYAAQSRIADPLPSVCSLSTIDRARYDLLCAKILERKAEIKPCSAHDVVVLQSSPVGLLALQHVLGTPTDSVIHLLSHESEHWFSEVYQPDGDPFWWYSFFWWTISNIDELLANDADYITANYPKPEGYTYWVVTDGHQWGGLAGGAANELWKWDGITALPIEVYSVDSF